MRNTDIINADESIIIHVSDEDHGEARRRNPYHCVFAMACLRLPHVAEAIVHVSTAYIRYEGEKVWTRYRVLQGLRDQIVLYDTKGAFEPGDYTLSTIQPSHQANGRRQGTKGNWRRWAADSPKRRGHVQLKGVRAPARIGSL